MSQAQKRRVGFLLAPIVTITAGMIAFMYYSGVEAAPPNTGPSLGDEAPSLQVLRLRPPRPVVPPPEYLLPLMIGPVPGLTTAWYEAPTNVPVPLGTTLEFKLTDLLPTMLVTWSGAVEVERGDTFSRAEYVPGAVGLHTVQAVVNPGAATESVLSSLLNVIDAPNITCTVAVSVPPLLVDANSTYYFGGTPIPEVARLRQDGPNHYHTSINQWITFTAQTQPTGFESMVEWRSGGAVLGLGQTLADQIITSTGSTIIEVGPVAVPEQVRIDTYSVTITSHVSNVDFITEGVPTTFTAVTDPPGYEADITWIASTKYGTVAPAVGSGPTFTVQFDDTWGILPDGTPFLWLGARADNARFVGDAIQCGPCEVEVFGVCVSICDVCEECVDDVCVPIRCGPCEVCINGECVSQCADCEKCENDVCVRIFSGLNEAELKAGHRANPNCKRCCSGSRVGPDELKDCLVTPDGAGTTFHKFGLDGSPAIPAGFFAMGSDPFVGTVALQGTPLLSGICFDADTVIQRSASPFVPCDPPGGPPVTVDIEIVALSLVSVTPITVTFNGGQNPEIWDVFVDISTVAPPIGTLTATKTHCNGGTFSSDLSVQPRFTFTKVSDPVQVRTLDTGLIGITPLALQSVGSTWIHGILIGIPTLDFIAGLDDPNPTLVCTLPDEPGMELTCNDGIDNDCDGLTDAADPDCP